MRLSFRSTLLALLATTTTAAAQVAETWSLPIDQSPLGDVTNAALVDPTGASTLVGTNITFRDGQTVYADAAITRVSADGTLLWHRTSNVSPIDRTEFRQVARGPDDSFYAGGSTVETNVDSDVVLARYGADGTELWSIRHDDGGYESATSIASDPSGDAWVVGTTTTTSGGVDALVLRVNPAGSIVFARTWNGSFSGTDRPAEIAADGQGGAYVTGQITASGGSAVMLLRFDAQGNVVWQREIPSPTVNDATEGLDLAVDASGNVYVAGRMGPTGEVSRPMLMKYDANGNALWVRMVAWPGLPRGLARSLAIDPRGDIVLAGTWDNFSATSRNVAVIQFDPAGGVVWMRNWSSTGARADEGSAIAIDAGGEIAVAGVSAPTSVGSQYDALALRLDRDGRVLWARTFGDPVEVDWSAGIGFGPTGSVVVAAVVGSTDPDARVVRYDDSSVPFCFGDGSGTACPCGNATPPSERAGCSNSLGLGGRLTADGSASLANDTLTLRGSGMPNASALYFQGTAQTGGGAGTVFGDGLRCAGGTVARLRTVVNVSGASQYPAIGDASISVRGSIAAPSSRTYQVWYRNAAAFCTPSTFNLTNGVLVTWTN